MRRSAGMEEITLRVANLNSRGWGAEWISRGAG